MGSVAKGYGKKWGTQYDMGFKGLKGLQGQSAPKLPKTPPMPTEEQASQAGDAIMRQQLKKKGFENAFGSVGNTGLKTTLG
jgi:hypothetical protein